MPNFEADMEAWKQLLAMGEIDEETYNKEISKLMRKAERKKNNNSQTFDIIRISVKTLFAMLFITLLFLSYKELTHKDANAVKYVKSLRNMPNPTQIATTGKAIKQIDNSNVEINFVAKYQISGRVVDIQKYSDNNMQNKLSPIDVGISWGALAKEENNEKIKWSSLGNRFLYWHSNDGEWISQMGGESKVSELYSNNHLIPSDDNIKKLIKSINVGDYIQIDGYLVNVYCGKNSGGYFKWNTSTSRTDDGSGACEIIYVTDIKWLKEEKNK